jgi:Uma2 family endonuclease
MRGLIMQASATISAEEPKSRRWTRDEYYQLGDQGMFQDQRVQLIEGEIVVMSPQNNSHVVAISLTQEALKNVFDEGYWVRSQAPLTVSQISEPEPDLSVVSGTPRDYTDHPTTALLIVEVSRTTLAFDRGEKLSLYAKADITDYWIVNLIDRQLEVFRNPTPDENQPYGFGYSEKIILKADDSISPLAAPESPIQVADLLP